jgi:hypothetical protein
VHAALVAKQTTIDDHLRTQFPSALFRPRGSSSGIDVLVAGCETGRHPIEVACKYKDAQSPPREVIVRSLVACACKESSPKNIALAVLLGPIGRHAVSSKYAVDADLSTKVRRLPAAKSTRISTLVSIC